MQRKDVMAGHGTNAAAKVGDKYAPGQSPFEKLPTELLGEFNHLSQFIVRRHFKTSQSSDERSPSIRLGGIVA
jgi:hypothetical protein